jgi:hypothetical protein
MIRVFPRRTKWTPDDELAFVGDPSLFRPAEMPVKISVAFTWDIPEAERLYHSWKRFYSDVELGGPAFGEKEKEFVPGRFLKRGAVITSRGCGNQCWFCEVWKRNGTLKELPITEGWNVMDDNILQSSNEHFQNVCDMLSRQSKQPIFSGGLDSKALTRMHVERILSLKPKRLYLAYDTEDDYDPLVSAAKLFFLSGLSPSSHILSAYCLIGYEGDTQKKAEKRLKAILSLGVVPMAMLYRNEKGKHDDNRWLNFQRHWARPRLIYKKN